MRVADVMAGADLTVGGFYAHFGSKEQLVAETIHALLGARRARLVSLRLPSWRQRIRTMLDGYLTRAHRDDPASGCPVPAVVGDIARDGTARDALAEELNALALALSEVDGDASAGDERRVARQTALGALALQAGGMVLTRALRGTPLSDEVLDATRAFGAKALDFSSLDFEKEPT